MSKSANAQDLINLSCYCDVYRRVAERQKSKQEADAKAEKVQAEIVAQNVQGEVCQQR